MFSSAPDNWSNEQKTAQVWFATPPGEREPGTQRALAEQLGVHEQTISRWKQLPGFGDAVTHLARQHLVEDLPAIYAALRNEAKRGSFQHIKLALELGGELHAKSARDHPDLDHAIPAEVERLIEQIYGQVQP